MELLNNLKEKLDKKTIRRIIFRIAVLVYMYFITKILTEYSSNILMPELFENERITVDGLMYVSMLFIGLVLFFREKSIIKFLISYHVVLIFTVLTVLLAYDKRPIILIPMLLSLFYDKGIGAAGAVSVCAFNVFTLAERPDYIVYGPEFMLTIVMLISAGTAAMVVNGKRKFYYEIPLYVVVYFVNVLMLKIFGEYCKDYVGCEMYYEDGFKFEASTGVLISLVIFAVVRVIYSYFAENVRLKKKLEEISMEDYVLVEEMKKHSKNLYRHSVKVAELAAKAAKAIGANEDLAFAGGLLHDVGKIAGTNYVNEGIKIANKYNLPNKVKNIIIEHNVKNRLPKTKESAIVMLADTAISAVDYLKVNNKENVDEAKVFENSLVTRLKNGALNDSTLTIEEFNKVKDAFLNH